MQFLPGSRRKHVFRKFVRTIRAHPACMDIVEVSKEWASKLFKPETWFSMSLGLKRLTELIQGTSSLTDDPVWLLGLWYGLHDADVDKSSMTPELHQLLLDDLNSRFWFTYRKDFPAIGGSSLSSDVGWGCTLRSGQMLMAEALSRCWWGRGARFTAQHAAAGAEPTMPAACQQSVPAALQQQAGSEIQARVCDQQVLLQLFVDAPGPQAPFSIHKLCAAGAPHGVVPGRWLGPWVLCKALAAAAAAAAVAAGNSVQQQQHHHHPQPKQQQQRWQQPLGLHVHVTCDPGGGAPELEPQQLLELLPHSRSSRGSSRDGSSSGSGADADSSSAAAGGSAQLSSDDPQQQQAQQQQEQGQPVGPHEGLLLLVPLTLGVGKVNERYLPQLAAILSFPQSVGIVGGRPGASLYFVGVQGGCVMYLDPHEVQEMPRLPQDCDTFHCSLPRLMPLAAIDPSLAIGFFCADACQLQDLLDRLQQLSSTAGGAPLMTVQQPGRPSPAADASAGAGGGGGSSGNAAAEGGKADDWELV